MVQVILAVPTKVRKSVPFITGCGITACRNVAQLHIVTVLVLYAQWLSFCIIVFREVGKCLAQFCLCWEYTFLDPYLPMKSKCYTCYLMLSLVLCNC